LRKPISLHFPDKNDYQLI